MNGPKDKELSRWRPLTHRVGIVVGTALVGLVATGTIMGATSVISANTVRVSVESASPPLSVSVAPARLQSEYVIPAQFVGRIEPSRDSSLGFEAGGTVARILVDEGESVSAGDVLAVLDTRILNAERDRQTATIQALDAQIELAKLTASRQKDLADRSFASQQRADETRLRVRELDARRAELNAVHVGIEVRLDKAILRAPYAGEIAMRHVDQGSRVGPMTPVVDLLETDAPRVRVGLPAQLSTELAPGVELEAVLDGQPTRLKLISLRSDMDPLTRTRSALFALHDQLPDGIAFGDVVRIDTVTTVPGHGAWVPVSALAEGTRGLWTVFLADTSESGAVSRRESVEVLYADESRAFIRGDFVDDALVIVDGPHRLGSGQPVQPRQEG